MNVNSSVITVSKRGKIIKKLIVPATEVNRIANEIHESDPRTNITVRRVPRVQS